jgi:hypothetical protein
MRTVSVVHDFPGNLRKLEENHSESVEVIDLGAGHSSSGGVLCGWVLTAFNSEALLNESVSAGYIDRHDCHC